VTGVETTIATDAVEIADAPEGPSDPAAAPRPVLAAEPIREAVLESAFPRVPEPEPAEVSVPATGAAVVVGPVLAGPVTAPPLAAVPDTPAGPMMAVAVVATDSVIVVLGTITIDAEVIPEGAAPTAPALPPEAALLMAGGADVIPEAVSEMLDD